MLVRLWQMTWEKITLIKACSVFCDNNYPRCRFNVKLVKLLLPSSAHWYPINTSFCYISVIILHKSCIKFTAVCLQMIALYVANSDTAQQEALETQYQRRQKEWESEKAFILHTISVLEMNKPDFVPPFNKKFTYFGYYWNNSAVN